MAAIGALRTYWPYLVMTILVIGPLFLPGYILTLDMVFTPSLPFPEHLTSSYLLGAALHWLSIILPGSLIQKLLLCVILLASSIGMHKLAGQLRPADVPATAWGVPIASIFFAANPFTYDRFMAGQYAVLLGYAVLPWLLLSLVRLWRKPGRSHALQLGLLLSLLGIVSLHSLGLAAILLMSAGVMAALQRPRKLRGLVRPALIAGGVFLAASSYWLLPLLMGNGRTADIVASFTPADSSAFATTGEHPLLQLINILKLQGFWAEERGLFTLPQEVLPAWGLVVLGWWALIIYGIRRTWKTRRLAAGSVLLASLCAIVISLGALESLQTIMPGVLGYREPQKFVAILALAYALFMAYGIDALLARQTAKHQVRYTATATACLLLPLLLTPTMVWGAAGQLRPRHYPPDWQVINQKLTSDPDSFQTLFLPWHQYMSYGFSGRIIASPAAPYFDTPMIVSDDPEIGGAIATTATPLTRKVGKLLQTAPKNTRLGAALKPHNVKYILLTKDYDYRSYAYLDRQQDVRIVIETDALILYRNLTWRPE